MCGVIGYQGKKQALPILLHGLSAMQYRGYDSAGVAIITDRRITCVKKSGPLACLTKALAAESLPGHVGLGHIRWATHGVPTDTNAHPHLDCHRRIAVVHNGVIANSTPIAAWLTAAGHTLVSTTDSELIAHLIEHFYADTTSLEQAVIKALAKITGTWGLLVMSAREPDKLVAVRLSSPLVIGLISPGQHIVASDAMAISRYARRAIYLEDHDLATISTHGCHITSAGRHHIRRLTVKLPATLAQTEKGAWPHFALKEIWAQPNTIKTILQERRGITAAAAQIRRARRFIITGCGSAYYAGLAGKYLFQTLAGIPTDVEQASELPYRPLRAGANTVVMAISQSGETADTIAATKAAKKHGALTLGLINVPGSTLTRLSDITLYTYAGPEIAVISTKAFTAQLTVLILLAAQLGAASRSFVSELLTLPDKIAAILAQHLSIHQLAQRYLKASHWLILGRSFNYPIALEGALKIKEISYAHAEGMAMGEMKHGALALIDDSLPSIAIVPAGASYQKNLSSMQEIKARGGHIIAIATAQDNVVSHIADDVIYIPPAPEAFTPLLTIIPLQLLAYFLAADRGLNVDQPRHLAKSVTVE